MRNREQYRGTKNICGIRIERLRKELGLKQKDLCESMALQGVPMAPSVLSKIEGQHRAINDYARTPSQPQPLLPTWRCITINM